jgi:hypothetical protein
MFDDDDTSFDGLSGGGTLLAIAAFGLTGWLCFASGNQQGLEAGQKCMAEHGCEIKVTKGFLGFDSLTVVHPSAAASSPEK